MQNLCYYTGEWIEKRKDFYIIEEKKCKKNQENSSINDYIRSHLQKKGPSVETD
jgi:hypothetical protein